MLLLSCSIHAVNVPICIKMSSVHWKPLSFVSQVCVCVIISPRGRAVGSQSHLFTFPFPAGRNVLHQSIKMMFQNHGMLEMMSQNYEMQHNRANPHV